MIVGYGSNQPRLEAGAWVAADATVCGNVSIGEGARIMHGARLVAEASGSLSIGKECIVLENAVVRATAAHACRVGDNCLIGPNAHVVGADLGDQVFVATGAAIFHGAILGAKAEVRVNGIVHLKTRLTEGAIVPIGWVAVGDPAEILPPNRHEEIWAIQKDLNFPDFVYGLPRETPDLMREVTSRLSAGLNIHAEETPLPT